jgi:hypothetical protein
MRWLCLQVSLQTFHSVEGVSDEVKSHWAGDFQASLENALIFENLTGRVVKHLHA